jgi:Cu(I)/Ag(I) efflux system periplasmic protein CusF
MKQVTLFTKSVSKSAAMGTAAFLAIGIAAPILPTHAQVNAPGMEQAKPAQAQEMVSAEVKKVDKESGRVTLTHGEVKSLQIPATTMAYQVKDPGMFEMLNEGAKVRVVLAKSATGYMVVAVEPAA